MSWASRRRFLYISGVIAFFVVVVGVPLAIWLYEPADCFDGIMNQGETAVDKGGPCKLLDERALIPHSVQWARPFKVRDGFYNAAAYIENPNQNAGVFSVPYRMKLYDSRNVLVAEHEDMTYIMPGAITPVFVGGMQTGERDVARAFFEFAAPLVWERMEDVSANISVQNKILKDVATQPRMTAQIKNEDVKDVRDVVLVAVVFDTAGNAFAASSNLIEVLDGGEMQDVIFVWPEPFVYKPARTDILPAISPED